MSQDFNSPGSDVSSPVGRQWLTALQSTSPDSPSDAPQIVFVSLPDVNEPGIRPADQVAPEQNKTDHREPSASHEPAPVTFPVIDVKGGNSAFADLKETPDQWIRESEKSSPARETPGDGTKSWQPDATIVRLVDKIMNRKSTDSPMVVLFASPDNVTATDWTCCQVSHEIASRIQEPVLWIDSAFSIERGNGSKGANVPGLTNFLTQSIPFDALTTETPLPNLNYVHAGEQRIGRMTAASERLSDFVKIAKSQFKMICVNVGDAHQTAACLWSELADGVFLQVSMRKSSQVMAKSAAQQLKEYGVRIWGCVAEE